MEWFYSFNGQQTGPVSDEELERLVTAGVVTPDTLVWRDGWADWKPYRLASQPVPPSFAAPSAGPPAQQRFCSECGGSYSAEQLTQYGSSLVCPACRPAFLGRTAAGVPVAAVAGRRYAGFWIRFAAIFIDGIVLAIAGTIVRISLGMFSTSVPHDVPNMGPDFLALLGISSSINFIFGLAYQGYFLSQFGATPGKMLFGLRVITSEGGPISVGRAMGRDLAYILDGISLLIGFLIAAFDSQKRALHDYICDTRVIHTR